MASDISASSETTLPGSLVLSALAPSDAALPMLERLFGGCAPRSRIAESTRPPSSSSAVARSGFGERLGGA